MKENPYLPESYRDALEVRESYRSMTREMLECEIARLYDENTEMDSVERGDRINYCRTAWVALSAVRANS